MARGLRIQGLGTGQAIYLSKEEHHLPDPSKTHLFLIGLKELLFPIVCGRASCVSRDLLVFDSCCFMDILLPKDAILVQKLTQTPQFMIVKVAGFCHFLHILQQ